jgi:predicted NAD/FAD-binding protein
VTEFPFACTLPTLSDEYKTMETMRNLHSCLCWKGRKVVRILEEPSPEQAKILHAFGYEVKKGVLQKVDW